MWQEARAIFDRLEMELETERMNVEEADWAR